MYILLILILILNLFMVMIIMNLQDEVVNPSYICSTQHSNLKWHSSLVQEQTLRWDIYYAQGFGGSMNQDDTDTWIGAVKQQSTELIKRELSYLRTYQTYISCLKDSQQSGDLSISDLDSYQSGYQADVNISYSDMEEITNAYNILVDNYNYNWNGYLENITISIPENFFTN